MEKIEYVNGTLFSDKTVKQELAELNLISNSLDNGF